MDILLRKISLGLFVTFSFQISTIFASELDTKLFKAKDAFNQEKYQLAEEGFASILKLSNNHLESLTYLARIKARNNKLDDAEELIEKAVKLAPNNAEVQHLSGKIYGEIAQEASVFTALGYAKDCLRGFTKAVELEPDNVDYRADLLSYHLNAPKLAGGDKNIALKQAKAIQQLDKKKGFIALLNTYTITQNEQALKRHIDNLPKSIAQDSDVIFNKGMSQQKSEQYIDAIQSFHQAIKYAGSQEEFRVAKYAAIYQIGRTSVLSKLQVSEGIKALRRYLHEAPSHRTLPSKEWAEFRLANLIDLNGDSNEAEKIYQKISKQTKDEVLKEQVSKVL
ncbi:tetratricopeptide repeat protein [Aliikangiella sp. IMCC44359]|uniref:tetratricopeptide repeat protein n=1 Tax=Aliikangiella sp. IMCC44359 TaxID=3459125 RepID=UPI00403A9B32